MPKSYRRAALGAATAALLSAAPAQAAPNVFWVSAHPQNPRTTTEARFGTYAGSGTFSHGWDFAGGSAFTPADSPFKAHTFSTDGVHPVAWQVTDSSGAASGRFIFATHPDNWAPRVTLESFEHAVTGSGYVISPWVVDDSPESGWTYGFEVDGDNDFNDGEVIDPERPDLRGFVFETDGAHPVKVRVTDGQGKTAEATTTYTTHSENRAPRVSLTPEVLVRTNEEVFLYAYTDDDYTGYGELVHEWYVDGVKVDGASSWMLQLPAYTQPGEHAVKLVVSEPGEGGLKSEATGVIRVVDEIPAGESGISVYKDGDYSATAPTFATLENASVYAHVPAAHNLPTTYEWDLDADGQFDDATLYETYFSALNKGAYKVAVRATPQGKAPIVVERTIVVDSGPDYAPKSDAVVVPPSTNQPPPVVNPPAQQQPVGKAIATIGSVLFSDGSVPGGKPGTTGQGINLKARSLFFGSVFSQKPAQVTVDYTVGLTKAGKVKASAAAKKKKAKVLKLGRSVVSLPGNASAPLKVKLSAKAKKALAKAKSVKVTAKIRVKDLAGSQSATATKTIKLKVVKK